MRVVDDAVAAALAALGAGAVVYASAERDARPPYFVHKGTDSRKGELGIAGMGGIESREYEHSILAVSDDPDEAEAMREAVVARFQGLQLAVAGWLTRPADWVGEVHDPGELLPGGAVVNFAGDKWKITIYRSRT